jgi:hypothetical protein
MVLTIPRRECYSQGEAMLESDILIIVASMIVLALAVWYCFHFAPVIPEYQYICANCGSVRKSLDPPNRKSPDVCLACSHSQLISTDTPRGRELMELYHGSTGIEERLRTAHEAATTLVTRLEGAVPSSEIAGELERLARLVEEGALSADEWQRAKAAVLGKPKDKQADAIERVSKLYRAYQSGAVSQSEFNLTKWDILARIGLSHYSGAVLASSI